MGFMIQRVNESTNVKQRVLGGEDKSSNDTKTMVASTAQDLLAADTLASHGQKIVITNQCTSDLLVAYGRTATLTDYTLPIAPDSTWIDDNHNNEKISGITTATGDVLIASTLYVVI